MRVGISVLLGLKATVLFFIFVSLQNLDFTLLSLPFLYASIVSLLVSLASHPSINTPMLLCKNPDGTFPIWSLVIFSPYLYFVRLFSFLRRFTSGEQPYSEICEGVYVGGWPYSVDKLPPGNPAIIDCTCEFPRKEEFKGHSYLCLPTWDTRAPQPGEIESAVKWACRKRAQNRPVFIHCAYGHGRSVAVMSALLVALGVVEDWKKAEQFIRERRPCISMNSVHYNALEEWSKHRLSTPKKNKVNASSSILPNLNPSSLMATRTDSESGPDNRTTNTISTTNNPAQVAAPPIYHLSFNQNHTCFSVGLQNGFRVFDADPFKPSFSRESDTHGGIGLVAMLYRSNLFCLVGGGPNPIYPVNKVMVWDDHAFQCIGELSFRSEVKNVKIRRDMIVVVLNQKIYIYNFLDLKLLLQIETDLNPNGLCEISQNSSPMVLVSLGLKEGQIRVEDFGSKKSKFVMAHDSRVVCMSLTQDGRLLATASTKGTLIRIFNTLDGTRLQEVRRGADRAGIHSLAFSSNAQFLAVSSDKGTVHIFSVKVDSGSLASLTNDRSHVASDTIHSILSSFSLFKGVLPKYFSSEWSVAQFRLPEGLRHFVVFGNQKNTIVIIGMDGSFYRCEFDPVAGGEMIQLEYHNFLNVENF